MVSGAPFQAEGSSRGGEPARELRQEAVLLVHGLLCHLPQGTLSRLSPYCEVLIASLPQGLAFDQ